MWTVACSSCCLVAFLFFLDRNRQESRTKTPFWWRNGFWANSFWKWCHRVYYSDASGCPGAFRNPAQLLPLWRIKIQYNASSVWFLVGSLRFVRGCFISLRSENVGRPIEGTWPMKTQDRQPSVRIVTRCRAYLNCPARALVLTANNRRLSDNGLLLKRDAILEIAFSQSSCALNKYFFGSFVKCS